MKLGVNYSYINFHSTSILLSSFVINMHVPYGETNTQWLLTSSYRYRTLHRRAEVDTMLTHVSFTCKNLKC